VVKTQLASNKALEGKTIAELSKSRGADALELFLDLALEEDLETVFVRSEVPDDEVVAGIIRSPYTNIGMSDAGAHVAFTAGYGVTSLVLGYWVRERQLLSLEEAVHRLSFKVASIFGIKDRGLVWPGWCADLVLLDPDEVEALEPEEEADYPGGFPRMVQHARGVQATIVNGEVLVENGAHTGTYPGRVLTSGARVS
jgi:N-acyl-D-aspartate/D-glutamate deacylase